MEATTLRGAGGGGESGKSSGKLRVTGTPPPPPGAPAATSLFSGFFLISGVFIHFVFAPHWARHVYWFYLCVVLCSVHMPI